MNINPASILSLIVTLYEQIAELTEEVKRLQAQERDA